MTRIIAGAARGRRLEVPQGRVTRPTSDRAREGLFAAVVAVLGSLEGASMLDLYAGSGAIGLEALSRGAADVLMIESDPGAAAVIRRNIASLRLPGARVLQDRVGRVLRRGPGRGGPRDLVFADPPYSAGDDELSDMLMTLADRGWLKSDTLVVLERDARSGAPPWPSGYSQQRSRRYGETLLWYGRASGAVPAANNAGA